MSRRVATITVDMDAMDVSLSHGWSLSGVPAEARGRIAEFLESAAKEIREEPAVKSPLKWEFDDAYWWAESRYHDEGIHFEWRISVEEDGTFSAKNTTPELVADVIPPYFESLAAAKDWCQRKEFEQEKGQN